MMLQTCARLIALAGPTVALLLLPLARFTEAAPGSPFQTTAPTAAPAANPKHDVPTGEYSVSPKTGAAGYGISIFTPPGRNGLVPQLGFGYSSQNPLRGGLAMGWSFDVPSIRVSTEDGLLGARRYVSSLAGNQRLVAVDEPNAGADVAESYRAHHDDSWTRYERIDDGTPEGQWRARTVDGRTYYFGETAASRDEDPNHWGNKYRWFVTRVVDPFGNEIRYEYDKVTGFAHNSTQQLPVDISLRSVAYGGNPGAGLPHHVRIDFVYATGTGPHHETCPGSDVPIGASFHYRSGLRIYEGARRLVRVETHVGQHGAPKARNSGAPRSAPDVRRITWLDYDEDELGCQGSHAPMRILEAVSVTGKSLDGRIDELPAERFEYSRQDIELAPADASFPFTTKGTGNGTSFGLRRNHKYAVQTQATMDRMWLDLDGDGLLDELTATEIVEDAPQTAEVQLAQQTRCAFQWRRNLGNGQLAAPEVRALPTMPWANGGGVHLGMRNDDESNYLKAEHCSLAAQFTRRASEPGVIPEHRRCATAPVNYLNYRFADVNGDDRPDLITAMSFRPGRYAPDEDPAVATVLGAPPSTDGIPMCLDEHGNDAPCIWDNHTQVVYAGTDDGPGGPGGGKYSCDLAGQCPHPSCNPNIQGEWQGYELGCPCSQTFCTCDENPDAHPHPTCDEGGGFWQGPDDVPPGEQLTRFSAGGWAVSNPNCLLQPETAGKTGNGLAGWPTHYVWRVYHNVGDGQLATEPDVQLSPVPLEDMALTSRLGVGLMASAGSWHARVDMDGDGYDDLVWQYPEYAKFWIDKDPPGYFVFRGDRHGNFHGDADGKPFVWYTPAPGGRRARVHAAHTIPLNTDATACRQRSTTKLDEEPPDWCRHIATDTYTTLADFNGDGLADFWHKDSAGELRVHFNTGSSFELTGTKVSAQLTSFSRNIRAPLSQEHASFLENGWSRSTHRQVDADGDGLMDVVELSPPAALEEHPLVPGPGQPVKAHINVGDALVLVGAPSHMQPWFAGLAQISVTSGENWRTITDFGDFNRDGIADLAGASIHHASCAPGPGGGISPLCGADAAVATLPDDGAGMRLLRKIHTGRGATVTFDYAPASRVVESDPASGSRSTAPLWVATKMTVAPAEDGAALEPGADVIEFPAMTTSYVYRYPVTTGTGADQARIHYRFRGFRQVETHAPRVPGEPGIITEAHYDYGLDKTGRQVAEITRDTDGKVYQVDETDYLRRSMFGGRVLTYHVSVERKWTCEGAASVDACKAEGLVVRTKNQWKALDGSDPLMAPDLPAKDHAPSSDQPDVVKSPIPIADPLPQKGTIVKKGFVAVADLAATTALGETVALSPGTKLSPGKTETVFEKVKDTVDGGGSGGSGMEDYQADGDDIDKNKTTTDPWDETPGALVYYLASQTVQDHLGPIAPGDRVSVHRRQLISRADAHILLETGSARYEALAGAELDDWDGWNLLARSASIYDEDALYLEAQYDWHTDKKVAKTAFDVDPETGRVMAVTRPRHAGTNKKVVHEAGQLDLVTWSTINELGHRTYAVYDLATGQPLVATDVPQASGIPGAVYQYDGFGRPTRVSRALFANAQEVAAMTPSWQIAVTLTRYGDRSSEVKTCTLIDEAPQAATSGSCSLPGADGAALWKQESIRADGAGRPAYAIAETDRGPAVTRFHYDAAGRLERATAPSPRGDTEPDEEVSFDYDVLGRPTRIDMPASADVLTEYELGRVTEIQTRDDGEELRKTKVSDAFGRMIRVIEYRGVADANGVHTEYSYDGNDNVASIARAADGIREDVASLRHDLAGNRIRLERDGQCWLFNYDRHGNLVSSAQPAVDGCPDSIEGAPPAYVATTVYDDIDRPISNKPATRGMAPAEVERLAVGHETLVYDDPGRANSAGRLSAIEKAGLGRIAVDYDTFGQPVAEERSLSVSPRAGVTLSIHAVTRLAYNAAGMPERVEHADDPSAPTITRYEYDRTGAPVAVYAERTGADDLLLARFERNLAGLVEARLSDVDAGQTWAYDGEGRVTRTEVTGISPAGSIGACTGSCVIAGQALSFDAVGNVKSLTDLATDVAFSYTYDARDQLLTATTSDGGLTYDGAFTYDAFGRLQAARVSSQLEDAGLWNRDVEYDYQPTGAADRADPDAVRRLVDRNTGSVRASFAYDRWGSLRAKTRDAASYSFVTDASNQLVEAEHAGDRETYYYLGAQRILAYRDAVGDEPARARHWFGATETWHAPDGAVVKHRVDVALAGSYVARIEDAEPGDPGLVFTGILGSILATVDANGQATARFGYGPYGEVLYADGPDAADMSKRFNGKELDELTDLAYYGYRYYDRDTLSWTAADPLFRYVPDAAWDEPRRGNLYAFSLNNPVRWVDPDGRDADDKNKDDDDSPLVEVTEGPGTVPLTHRESNETRRTEILADGTHRTTYVGRDGKYHVIENDVEVGVWDIWVIHIKDRRSAVARFIARMTGAIRFAVTAWVASVATGAIAGGGAAVLAGVSARGAATAVQVQLGSVQTAVGGAAAGQGAVVVTRWGEKGLKPGAWVMRGGNTWWNYLRSFKWQPAWLPGNNIPAAKSAAESFLVEKSSIVNPYSESWVSNIIKWLWGQKQYLPKQ